VFQQSLIPSFEAKELHSSDLVAADVHSALSSEIKAFKNLANPELCELKYLPFLAYAFKVDFWDEDLSESDKRALIKQSLVLHRYKGTVWAIEKVFEALNLIATTYEWFDYNGEPYHFKVDISMLDKEITTKKVEDLIRYIEIFKNVRSVLDEVSVSYLMSNNKLIATGCVCEIMMGV